MAVAYQAVSTNDWTAEGTTTLTKPTGTVDGDFLIAFLAEDDSGTATINSVPSGWTLIHSTTGSNSNTLYSYYKVASSEGASWDWGWNNAGNSKAGIVLRIDGQSLITPFAASDDGTAGNDDTPTFTGGVTPTYANSLLVFGMLSVQNSSATGHSGYAITTSNPTWTERAELNSGSSDCLSVATALRPEVTATGDFSAVVDSGGGTSDTCGHLIAISPRVDATVSPTVITATFSVQAPTVTGSASVTTSTITATFSVQAPTVTTSASKWLNQDKNSSSWNNQDKN